MKTAHLVYGLVDPRDERVRYVGKSSCGLVRPRSHFCPSRLNERTYKAHWISSVIAAGFTPRIIILRHCSSVRELDEAERFFIAYFRSLGHVLTNATDGGEGAPGVRLSAETRAKMSAASLGKPKSPAHRAAIAKALLGHSVADETRAMIGAHHAGNKYCMGRKLSDASRKKMSESVARTSPARGKAIPEIRRLKISASARKRVRAADGTFLKKSH
jgi:NUMOD3 motif